MSEERVCPISPEGVKRVQDRLGYIEDQLADIQENNAILNQLNNLGRTTDQLQQSFGELRSDVKNMIQTVSTQRTDDRIKTISAVGIIFIELVAMIYKPELADHKFFMILGLGTAGFLFGFQFFNILGSKKITIASNGNGNGGKI